MDEDVWPTLAELIEKYRITAEFRDGAEPNDWFPEGVGYTATLRRGLGYGAEDPEEDIAPRHASEYGLTTPFYTGGAWGEPTAEDVLRCLILDAREYDNARDFEEWAEELGYDPDSRKAEALYHQIGEARDELIEFLSDSSTIRRVRAGRDGIEKIIGGEHYDEFLEADLDG